MVECKGDILYKQTARKKLILFLLVCLASDLEPELVELVELEELFVPAVLFGVAVGFAVVVVVVAEAVLS